MSVIGMKEGYSSTSYIFYFDDSIQVRIPHAMGLINCVTKQDSLFRHSEWGCRD